MQRLKCRFSVWICILLLFKKIRNLSKCVIIGKLLDDDFLNLTGKK